MHLGITALNRIKRQFEEKRKEGKGRGAIEMARGLFVIIVSFMWRIVREYYTAITLLMGSDDWWKEGFDRNVVKLLIRLLREAY